MPFRRKPDSAAEALEAQVEAAERRWLEEWRQGPTRLRWDEIPLQVGDAAPDFDLPDATGKDRRLGEFWSGHPALIIFWRHYGCGCGNLRAQRLVREHGQFVKTGAAVVIVGQAEPERTAAYADRFHVPCTMLCDPGLMAYRAYGLRDGQASQVFYDGPDGMRRGEHEAGVQFAEARHLTKRPVVDSPWLLPGEFVVDATGTVRLAYRYQYCENFPDLQVLLAAIRAAG